MTRLRNHFAALFAANAALLFSAQAQAGSWQANAPFGATLQGDLYTPTTPAASPAILVVVHMCTGHASTTHGWFQSYADAQGFYLIAPDAGKQCFDSSATRGGDRAAIVKMVNYVVMNKNADKSRVFVAGMSSGGCMTNTLLGIYPDVFAGGSAMPGFTAGGWPAGDTTCTKCSSSPPSMDGKYWGDIARNAFAWSGKYPCSQQWVGGGDEYNFNGWLPAVAAQFQNLSSLSAGTPGTAPSSGWTRTNYADSAGNVWLETNLGPTSQKHDIENVGPTFVYKDVIRFLGLDKATGACGLTTSGTGGAGGMSSTGGAPATGGASAGGAPSTGGMPNTGGRVGTGGVPATGGTPATTGGAPATAGVGGTGGTASSTGGTATGGTGTPTAGRAATAGSPGVSGAPSGTGGATSASGGRAGSAPSGGAPASSGASSTGDPETVPDAPACGCSVPGRSTQWPLATVLAAGIGAFFARRQRNRS